MRWHITAVGCALAALAGCDTNTRTASSGAEAPSADRRSREHETCSRTADCAADLRCFDGVCRRTKESVVGELYTALGDREIAAGRVSQAAEAYAGAHAHYEQDKIEPPAPLFCAEGSALASQPRPEPAALERAARLLHQCLLGSPPGSFLHGRALGDLAGLVEHGLDPDLIARPQPAEAYLTRKPGAAPAPAPQAAPGTQAGTQAAASPAAAPTSVEVKVAMDSRSRASSLRKLTAFLEKSEELRTALTACWKAHFDKTQKDTLSVSVPLQYGAAWDEDEVHLFSWVKLADAPAPTDPPAAEATTCARAAVGPLVAAQGKKLHEETRWQAVATFTVAPAARP